MVYVCDHVASSRSVVQCKHIITHGMYNHGLAVRIMLTFFLKFYTPTYVQTSNLFALRGNDSPLDRIVQRQRAGGRRADVSRVWQASHAQQVVSHATNRYARVIPHQLIPIKPSVKRQCLWDAHARLFVSSLARSR